MLLEHVLGVPEGHEDGQGAKADDGCDPIRVGKHVLDQEHDFLDGGGGVYGMFEGNQSEHRNELFTE